MFTLLAAAVIATAPHNIIDSCPWADRGLDRFGGDLVASVDNYTAIPKVTRQKLQARMAQRKYDEITHLSASGNQSDRYNYGPPTYMHFGTKGRICRTVDTSMWAKDDPGERGLVYCEDGHCVVIWTVCRNLSRIERLGPRYPGLRMSMITEAQKKDEPPATVELPPVAEISFPPIVSDAELPPVSFAAQLEPRSVVQDVEEPVRMRASQTFFELEHWRPLLRERRSLMPVTSSIGPINWVPPVSLVPMPQPIPSVPGLVVTTEPVPGVAPVDNRVRIPVPSVTVEVPFETPLTKPVKTPAVPFDGDGAPVGSVAAVPEPGTWLLMALGLCWVCWQAKKRGVL